MGQLVAGGASIEEMRERDTVGLRGRWNVFNRTQGALSAGDNHVGGGSGSAVLVWSLLTPP